MKKLLTIFSVIMLLMAPIKAIAWDNVYLHGDHFSGGTGWEDTSLSYGSGNDWYVIVNATSMVNGNTYGWGLKNDSQSWTCNNMNVDMSTNPATVTWNDANNNNNSLTHRSSYKAYKVHLTWANSEWTSEFTGYTYDLVQFKGGYNGWTPRDFTYDSTTGEYTFEIIAVR